MPDRATIEHETADFALVTKAEALTLWFSQAGWLPERGNIAELKDFCASIIRNLEDDPAVRLYDPDYLLAIGAGITNGLSLLNGPDFFQEADPR
jgi:hypothetical protein